MRTIKTVRRGSITEEARAGWVKVIVMTIKTLVMMVMMAMGGHNEEGIREVPPPQKKQTLF